MVDKRSVSVLLLIVHERCLRHKFSRNIGRAARDCLQYIVDNMKGVLMVFLLMAGGTLGLGRTGSGRNTALRAPPLPHGVHLPQEKWFIQTLDHFSPTDIRTWRQVR